MVSGMLAAERAGLGTPSKKYNRGAANARFLTAIGEVGGLIGLISLVLGVPVLIGALIIPPLLGASEPLRVRCSRLASEGGVLLCCTGYFANPMRKRGFVRVVGVVGCVHSCPTNELRPDNLNRSGSLELASEQKRTLNCWSSSLQDLGNKHLLTLEHSRVLAKHHIAARRRGSALAFTIGLSPSGGSLVIMMYSAQDGHSQDRAISGLG
jgi:hypothetical protein